MKTKVIFACWVFSVICFAFISCDDNTGGANGNTEPKKFTITELSLSGEVIVTIAQANGISVAMGTGIVSGNKLTVDLKAGDEMENWTGNGPYLVALVHGSDWYFFTNGGALPEGDLPTMLQKLPKYNIENTESIIGFSKFKGPLI